MARDYLWMQQYVDSFLDDFYLELKHILVHHLHYCPPKPLQHTVNAALVGFSPGDFYFRVFFNIGPTGL